MQHVPSWTEPWTLQFMVDILTPKSKWHYKLSCNMNLHTPAASQSEKSICIHSYGRLASNKIRIFTFHMTRKYSNREMITLAAAWRLHQPRHFCVKIAHMSLSSLRGNILWGNCAFLCRIQVPIILWTLTPSVTSSFIFTIFVSICVFKTEGKRSLSWFPCWVQEIVDVQKHLASKNIISFKICSWFDLQTWTFWY